MSKITFSGDFKTLQKWANQVATAPDVLDDIGENLGEEAIELVKEGFENERDPYGKPWAKLKRRTGRILQDTGRLKGSYNRVYANRTGFKIATGVKYAQYHQRGTARMVARRMVPNATLPAEWRKRFVEVAGLVLEAHFTK